MGQNLLENNKILHTVGLPVRFRADMEKKKTC